MLQVKLLATLTLDCPEMEELRNRKQPLIGSKTQDEVMGYLTLISPDVSEEYDALDSGGLMSADARVGDVLVEVHGPQHYLTSLPRRNEGGTSNSSDEIRKEKVRVCVCMRVSVCAKVALLTLSIHSFDSLSA